MKKDFLLKQDPEEFYFLVKEKRIPDDSDESLGTIFNYYYDDQKRPRERVIYVETIGNRSIVGAYCFLAPPKDAAIFASVDQQKAIFLDQRRLLSLMDIFETLLFPDLKITNWEISADRESVIIQHEPKQK